MNFFTKSSGSPGGCQPLSTPPVRITTPVDFEEKIEVPQRQALPAPLRTALVKVLAPGKTAKTRGKKMGKPSKARTGDFSSSVMNYRVGDAARDGVKAWNFIKRFLNVEEKMFDSQSTGPTDTITYSGTVYNLSNIAQGNDYNNREGNSILVQKLRIAVQVASSNTASQVQGRQLIRIMVLRDLLQNGADPSPSTILETVGVAGAPIFPMLHFIDKANPQSRRFRVLHDEVTAFVPPFATNVTATGTGTVDLVGSDQRFQLLQLNVGSHTTYQGTTGADASNFIGGLYLMAISNVQTNGPALTFHCRLYFTDN